MKVDNLKKLEKEIKSNKKETLKLKIELIRIGQNILELKEKKKIKEKELNSIEGDSENKIIDYEKRIRLLRETIQGSIDEIDSNILYLKNKEKEFNQQIQEFDLIAQECIRIKNFMVQEKNIYKKNKKTTEYKINENLLKETKKKLIFFQDTQKAKRVTAELFNSKGGADLRKIVENKNQ